MTIEVLVPGIVPTPRSPRTVVATLTARKAVRSGMIWGCIFGLAIASSAISYTRLYKTSAQRNALASAYGSNKATATLFGPAPRLQTVAGFTAFKIGMTLMVLGAVWGLLTSTRLLRGEEDNGRWELLLTGQTTRSGATGQALAGLASGLAALFALTAVITVITGLDASVSIAVRPGIYFALAMVATALMFLTIGAVTSQLAATRRQAAAYAAVVLGVAYAIRMIADAGIGLHKLIWLSPLGWVEELQPLTAPQPLVLVPIALLTAALAAAAVQLAGRRDIGESIIADRPHTRSQLRLLVSPAGLAVRLMRASVLGWVVAIAVSGLLYGVIAKSAGATIHGSSVHGVFARLGVPESGAAAVLGVCFLVLAVLVSFVAAGQLTMVRSEEATGRLDHLLVQPVSRARWLGGRWLVAVIVLLGCGLCAGLFAWLGSASQHAGVALVTLLGSGVNLVPPAIVILGVGVLAFGFAPRSTSAVVYGYLGWSLLVVVVGGIGAADRWALDTSVFHQMASSPAVPPDWSTNGVMVLVGILAALVGGGAFIRRDVQGA